MMMRMHDHIIILCCLQLTLGSSDDHVCMSTDYHLAFIFMLTKLKIAHP